MINWQDARNNLESNLRSGFDSARKAVEDGASWVKSSFASVPLFASVEASVAGAGEARDETHYFLVPFRLSECGYALYSTRRIAEGYAVANDLPKLRVFHLPGPGGEKVLESLLFEEVRQAIDEEGDKAESIGQRLEDLADTIDRHTGQVTGGVLLIGGVVALTNPLLGAGIAAKAILPSLGGLLSREGLRQVSSKLSVWQRDREDKKKDNEARQEVRSVRVVSQTNPFLEVIERAIESGEADYDPSLEFCFESFVDHGWDPMELRQLSASVILRVYAEVLEDPSLHPAACLGDEDLRFLELLRVFADPDLRNG